MSAPHLLHGIGKFPCAFFRLVKFVENSALNCVLRQSYSKSIIGLVKLLREMPKENKKNVNKSKFRVNRDKYKNEPASIITLQVIGTGANGTPKAVCVFSDHQSYLFNCGEGTQRLSNEHKTKICKTDNIFITYKHWDNVGGLAGLTLTFQDIGVGSYTIHGPPGVEDLFDSMKSFMSVAHVKRNKHEYFDPPFKDGVFVIESVPIFSTKCVELGEEVECSAEVPCDEQGRGSRSRSPSPTQMLNKRQKLAPQLLDRRDVSIAYICKNHDTQGHLLMDKCKELGIPTGPILGKLKKGEDITLPDGRTIKSTDVVSPTTPGSVFIVIEIPSEHFLDSLLDTETFKKNQTQQTSTSNSNVAQLIVHFTPNDVISHPKYRIWMKKFPESTVHLVVNESCSGVANAAVYKLQHKLNVVHPGIFPLLRDERDLAGKRRDEENFVFAEPLLLFSVKPKLGFDRSRVVRLEPEVYLSEVVNAPNWREKFRIFNLSVERSGIEDERDTKYPQVTFLGTGSCIPSKVRNVSCILLKINESKWMILDCGEGSYGQILRFFGSKTTESIMKNLVAIFISHLHADHHTGLIKILHERQKVLDGEMNSADRKLYLLAPFHIIRWLNAYHKTISPILGEFHLISNSDLVGGHLQMTEKYLTMVQKMELKDVSTVKVIHRALTFGAILTFKDGVKFVYSGDTMPCDDLVKAGMNCDLLIHEATMEDFLAEDAKNKTHSTTSQAIDVGHRMEAKFTMLTHFSQRYAKVPIFTDTFNNSVGVAFDNMTVSMNNVGLTSLFRPILEVIFSEEIEEMLDKREMKMRQKVWEQERKKNEKETEIAAKETAVE